MLYWHLCYLWMIILASKGCLLENIWLKFRYERVLFMRDGKQDFKIDHQLAASAAVMQSLYLSVVVKTELSYYAKLSANHLRWIYSSTLKVYHVAAQSTHVVCMYSVRTFMLMLPPTMEELVEVVQVLLRDAFWLPPSWAAWTWPTGRRSQNRYQIYGGWLDFLVCLMSIFHK